MVIYSYRLDDRFFPQAIHVIRMIKKERVRNPCISPSSSDWSTSFQKEAFLARLQLTKDFLDPPDLDPPDFLLNKPPVVETRNSSRLHPGPRRRR